MTAVGVLQKALAQGGRVEWNPPDKPRLFAPPSLHEAIKADRETVKEILRRAAIFRGQAAEFIQDGKAIPRLVLPDRPDGDGCLSCGVPIPSRRYRCEACTLAVTLALQSDT